MIDLTFNVGNECWIYCGTDEVIERGTVVNKFVWHGRTYYVVEVDAHDFPVYLVRSGFEMSDEESLPIGMWRSV